MSEWFNVVNNILHSRRMYFANVMLYKYNISDQFCSIFLIDYCT